LDFWDGAGMDAAEVMRLNSLQLAYVGDTVWELTVRSRLIQEKLSVRHMHAQCVLYVNAHAQSVFLKSIEDDLSEAEKEIVRRGRNAHARHPAPRHQEPEDYAASTAFEALIGFLYLTRQNERLQEIITTVFKGDWHG